MVIGVDAKGICPSPNKSCLDEAALIVADTRYLHSAFLAVFPVLHLPPSITIKLGRGSVEDRQGGYRRPSRTCGTRLCHRKLDFGGAVSAVRS